MDFGKELLKAIYNNYWCKIEYKNINNQETKYMIGVNFIDIKNKRLRCDIFNISKNTETIDGIIYYDNILNLEICDDTYHKSPIELLKFIDENDEALGFLKRDINKNNLIDYYIDCFKLDTVPYISKYGLVPGIDNDVLDNNACFPLDSIQFERLSKESFYKKDNSKKNDLEKIERSLVINELSIKNNDNTMYVLAFRHVKLDIKNKCLVADDDICINVEFYYDSDNERINKKASINKFIPEEEYELIDNFKENKAKIVNVIREYNNTRKATYVSEIKIDTNPFFITLEKNFSIDVDREFAKIKKIINSDNIPLPLRTFFGDSKSKLVRRNNYPIFTIDNKFNIDQINAINIGMKSPASYIQGPPGTGKTQTLLNAILTSLINNKTVLVTSNNNIPMNGVYDDICNLKYNDKEQLLFPAIRLGRSSYCEKAVLTIRRLYEAARDKKIFEGSLDNYKKAQRESTKELVSLLDKHERYLTISNRLNSLMFLNDKCDNEWFKATTISPQVEELRRELDSIGEVNMDKFESLMYSDYNSLFKSIHFETAKRFQKLSKERYKELFDIIKDACEENKKDKAKDLRRFLQDPEKLELFKDIFPIIITTNLSCSYLGDGMELFDIVMMDEAGQCNVANALIPISKGKQIMLVGDPQQLRPVIVLDKNINKKLKNKYHIPDEYDYIDNSIYTAYTKVDVKNTETLLSYHYRCDAKIINFSNKKYYNNKLIIKSKINDIEPLEFIDTTNSDKSYGDVKNAAEAEAAYIVDYIKKHNDEAIGVITPFVMQKQCIEYNLNKEKINNISVGTVHSFQGDQKDVIIFSTAITNRTEKNTYNWLKNNRELINVAISRAKKKFILLANENALEKLSDEHDDIFELMKYVKTEGNTTVTNVSPKSFALGTRHLSTESERELGMTINQILSVIDTNSFIKEEVSIASILNDIGNTTRLFYQERFDLVLFEKTFSGNIPLLAIELNGPEHYSDEEVMKRDKEKKRICDQHHLKLLTIPRDCARDYDMLKKTLVKLLNKK